MTLAHPTWNAIGRKAWVGARFVLFGISGLYLALRFGMEFLFRLTSGSQYAGQFRAPALSLLFTVLGVVMMLFGVGITDARVRADPSQVTLGWRRVVALASLLSAIGLVAAVWLRFSQAAEWFPTLLWMSPFWLPYVFIVSRLKGARTRSGLSLAVAMGSALFLPGMALIYYVHEWGTSWWIQGMLLVALVLQPVLAIAAFRGYKSLPGGPNDRRTLATSGAYGCLLFAAFWFGAFYGNFPDRFAYDESQAMESMRSIFMAADVYAKDHDGAFPANATTWRPESQEECRAYYALSLASQQADYGYVFDYRGEIGSKPSHGCKVARSYVSTARPAVFGKDGRRSFFVDQTHVIRFTQENRAATVSDPEIPAGSLPPL